MTNALAGEFVSQDQLAALPLAEIRALPPAARRLPKVAAVLATQQRLLLTAFEGWRNLARRASAVGDVQEAGRYFRAAEAVRQQLAAMS